MNAEEASMANSTTDAISVMQAEAAIHRTLFHYFRLLDIGEHERVVVECFAPDAVMSYSTLDHTTSMSGRAEITEFYKHVDSDDYPAALERALHVIGGSVIDWTDGRPTLRATVTVWHWYRRNAAAGRDRVADKAVIGFEEIEFTDVDGAWLFHQRAVQYQATPIVNYEPV